MNSGMDFGFVPPDDPGFPIGPSMSGWSENDWSQIWAFAAFHARRELRAEPIPDLDAEDVASQATIVVTSKKQRAAFDPAHVEAAVCGTLLKYVRMTVTSIIGEARDRSYSSKRRDVPESLWLHPGRNSILTQMEDSLAAFWRELACGGRYLLIGHDLHGMDFIRMADDIAPGFRGVKARFYGVRDNLCDHLTADAVDPLFYVPGQRLGKTVRLWLQRNRTADEIDQDVTRGREELRGEKGGGAKSAGGQQ